MVRDRLRSAETFDLKDPALGDAALSLACAYGHDHADVVCELLKLPKVDVNETTDQPVGRTVLMLACEKCHLLFSGS
jgi:hypothetical protein